MRTILHIDLDAFYAAVEQRDDPKLRGKPVLVGGSIKRGVVASCSYEARVFGIKSAMPMAEAMRRCPQAIVVPVQMERYVEASQIFFAILGDFSPEVEGLSLDEAFIDCTGTERLLGDPETIARAIKRRVAAETQLVASVGVAPIKFAAKIASDIDKPDGLRIVTPENLLPFLQDLPVTRLWGVGEATRAALASMGLETIGQVARYPEQALVGKLGAITGHHLAALARGEDSRSVEAERDAVTIGHRETFEHDLDDKGELAITLLSQADRVAVRLRAAELRARARSRSTSSTTTSGRSPGAPRLFKRRATVACSRVPRSSCSRRWRSMRDAAAACGCAASRPRTSKHAMRPASSASTRPGARRASGSETPSIESRRSSAKV